MQKIVKVLIFCVLCQVLAEPESVEPLSAHEEASDNGGLIMDMDSLYKGNSVTELLKICKTLKESDFYTEPDSKKRLCPDALPGCIRSCSEHRVMRLREAQNRVTTMLASLKDIQLVVWQLFFYFTVLVMGGYLVCVGRFNWRTLPYIGYKFETDPTDGYRYRHYVWMRWVILDSMHPSYYGTMTPDTHELVYVSQADDWEEFAALVEDEVESDEDDPLHPVWSVRDICDMTADPSDRLEFYFRRVMLKYQVSKPPRPLRMYNKKRERQLK